MKLVYRSFTKNMYSNLRILLNLTRKNELSLKESVWLIQSKYNIVEFKQGCIYGYNNFEMVDVNLKDKC